MLGEADGAHVRLCHLPAPSHRFTRGSACSDSLAVAQCPPVLFHAAVIEGPLKTLRASYLKRGARTMFCGCCAFLFCSGDIDWLGSYPLIVVY